MPKSCAAFGCTNESDRPLEGDKRISFHLFPRDPQTRHLWIAATKRKDFNPGSHACLCSEHFEENCFVPGLKRRKLFPNAAPTIFKSLPDYYQPPGKQRKSSAIEKRIIAEISAPSNEDPCTSTTHEAAATYQSAITGIDETDILRRRIEQLERTVSTLKKKLQKSRRRTKVRSMQKRRLAQKVEKFTDLIAVLRQQKDVSQKTLIDLRNRFDDESALKLMNELLQPGLRPQKYSDEVREFASSLFFRSPSAYHLVRKLLQLPSPSTIRSWLSNHECNPGFTQQAFSTLAQKLNSTDIEVSRFRYCALVIDDMSLKKNVQWDKNASKFIGYVDLGFEASTTEEATKAFVIMAVGLLGHWKITLGYFLTNGLSAKTVSQLIKETIIRLHGIGVIVISVTFDGASHQIAALEILGASFSHFLPRPHFPHPCDSSRNVVAVLDICHMIKLIRNALHFHKTFFWEGRGKVEWKYYELLSKLQTEHGIRAGNKITKEHIEFENKKMRVYLSTQLFSRSVADALRFCHASSVEGFENDDVLVTADFTQVLNDIFDLLNTRSLFGKGTHAPVTKENFREKKALMSSTQELLRNLSIRSSTDSIKVLSSRRKTGFIGIFQACEVLSYLYDTLIEVERPDFSTILFYKFSQDFLESFFASIRCRNGWTLNPTCAQFRFAYRSLLFHGSKMIKPSLSSNTQAQDSTTSLVLSNTRLHSMESDTSSSLTLVPEGLHTNSKCNLSSCRFCQASLSYIGGFIVKASSSHLSCDYCKAALLHSNDDAIQNIDLISIKNRGGLIFPSQSVIDILKVCERYVRKLIAMKEMGSPRLQQKMKSEILAELSRRPLFSSLRQHDLDTLTEGESHVLVLQKWIIQKFVNLRMRKIGRDISVDLSALGKSSKLMRTSIFQNL